MEITPTTGPGMGRAGPTTDRAGTAAPADGVARAGAWVVYLGTLVTTVGLSWDIQWHVEVGPDTFFTLPHLALYSGSALSGVASLVMVLVATAAQRGGTPLPPAVGGTPVRVFGGTFSAPLGYLVSGIGAASFLLYGLLDLWWHSLYGFDAVLNSPPHVALFLSISITMVGSLITFTAARGQRWGRLGVLLAVPILITFAPITLNALSALDLPLDPTVAGIIFFSSLLLIVGAAVLRSPGAAVAVAAVLGVMQAVLWWFSPWAAETYAASTGLPLRDGLTPQPPELPGSMPMFLVVAALVVAGALRLSRTRATNARTLLPITGALVGLIVAVTLPVQQALADPTAGFDPSTEGILAVVGLLLGALAGFLATRFATMLAAVAPVGEVAR